MKKGFTLIELLVVIGILGILMAVLVGAIGGSTSSAQSAKCLANMRNLAMAVQSTAMATSDNPEWCFFPFAGSYKTPNGKETKQGWIGWASDSAGGYVDVYEPDAETRTDVLQHGMIWKSLNGGSASYVCPGHVRRAHEKNLGEPLWSYAMNAYFGWAGNRLTHGRWYTSFKRTDRYLLFAELPYAKVQTETVSQEGNISGQEADPVLQYPGCAGGGDEAIGFNHKDGRNYVAHVCFADGHAEKLIAPKTGDVKELTQWLCRPRDDEGNDFDISFDGKRYKKVQ